MKISEFSVKHSLLVNLISLFILLSGFFTLYIYKIPREAFPEVSFDMVIVNTVYPGAAPEEIEKLVTVPIEKEIKGVDGIEEMSSVSIENASNVLVKISQDIKDKDKVVDDIQKAVDRVRGLPAGVEDKPLVTDITSGEIPVIQVALSGQVQEKELQGHADSLEDILEDINGVSSVSLRGYRKEEVWVEVDPAKLKEIHISLEEIMEALRDRNISIPGGKLRSQKEFSIRTTGEFYTAEDIEDVVIRANDMGNWLRIKDVAEVRFAFEDEDMINKSRGTRSIILTVVKRSSGDTIKIVDQVKVKTQEFMKSVGPEVKASYINDISYYIKRRLGVLKNNGIIGLCLVLVVLMIFLNFRVALLTALGIPIAFAATLSMMGVFGISVNLITMFGLIIVLGMLVDDGIIVAENCSRHLEDGLSPKEAAIKGAQEVAKPVTATIITTIAAFSPLLFMKGMLGKFIWGIPLVVVIALSASLIEALVILPSHFSDFVRRGKKNGSRKEQPWFKKMMNLYTRILNGALRLRYLVFVGLILILLATGLLGSRIPFVLFSSEEGVEQFYIRAETLPGTNLYATNELIQQIEEVVEKLPKDQLDAYTTEVGSIGESWMFDPYGKTGGHVAQVTVYLTPYTQRKKTVNQIISGLKDKLKNLEGFQKVYYDKEGGGPPVGKPIAIKIRGEDFDVLEEISNKITKSLEGIEGVRDISSDYEVGRGQMRVVVDEQQAKRAFLSVGEIAASIRNTFKGGVATSIKPIEAEEEIDVLVRFPEEYRKNKDSFDDIVIPNRFGNLVPLNKIAKIEEGVSMARINHVDGKRVITIRADVDNKEITSWQANSRLEEEFKDIPREYPGYSLEFGGEQEENIRSRMDFLKAFILALFLIFLILAANFNSLVQPAVVMLAIPFGLIGVVWAFFFHGLNLSFFMMMGVIGLMGIVVNDSIVLVEFINKQRREGVGRRESIVQGGRLRLRPVLLTSITTAFGLAPTAYGLGGGDPFLKPMALTIVWGILCATVLTLIVLPCIYAIIDDINKKVTGHASVAQGS